MDHDYRVTARQHKITVNTRGGDDLTHFPIEKARFRSLWYAISAVGSTMVGYGWAMHSRVVRNHQILDGMILISRINILQT
jgi:hypothetical protein